MDFWERLKSSIKKQNVTQEWIAKKCNISFGTFRKWMSRKTMPNADQAVDIANALNTTVEYLVSGTENFGIPDRLRSLCHDMELLSDDDLDEIKALVAVKNSRSGHKAKHA